MRNLHILLPTVVLLMAACTDPGVIDHRLRFTDDAVELTGKTHVDTFHTQFGPYITSVTPYKLFAKMNILMYLDNLDQQDPATHMFSYIDGHDNDPNQHIELDIDFSDNQEFSVTPIMYSTDIRDGLFEQKEVTFRYFHFIPYYMSLSFEVPLQYKDVVFTWSPMNDNRTYDPVLNRVTYTCMNQMLEQWLYPADSTGNHIPMGYVFGGTDSTYIFNPGGLTIPPDQCLFGGPACNNPVIRSNRFSPVTVTMPDDGESIEMFSTISFNSDGLIHIYAGQDGIPYSGDDKFVYAPRYWERATVRLEVR